MIDVVELVVTDATELAMVDTIEFSCDAKESVVMGAIQLGVTGAFIIS